MAAGRVAGWIRRIGTVGVAAGLPACSIVTGSTDGYSVDAGSGVTCAGDGGCVGYSTACSSVATCEAGTDGGAQICCLAVESASYAAASCGASPCLGSFSWQLCASGTECAVDAGCVLQQCPLGGAIRPIHACGVIPICKAE